jgi:PncC family amidohydrolase
MMSQTESRLEHTAGALLLARGWTICAAESCTGGLLLSRLTDIPGSSAWVMGGIVAYANAVKRDLLGVPEALLTAHGAVSAPVAEAMVRGVIARLGADVAISITGIAGPGGAQPDKPVGLTYIALLTRGGQAEARRFVWMGTREENKRSSADAALSWLIDVLRGA